MGVAWLADKLQVIDSGLLEVEHKAEEGAEQRTAIDEEMQGKDCQDREVVALKIEEEVACKAKEELRPRELAESKAKEEKEREARADTECKAKEAKQEAELK